MIKGTTTIEIKDVHNDEITTIKKDNLVTNGAQVLLGKNPFGMRYMPEYGQPYGFSGFDCVAAYAEPITADKDNLAIQSDPVAIAGTVSTSSIPDYGSKGGELIEQEWTANSWTRKWRWPKKNGNGIINTIALSGPMANHLTSIDGIVPLLQSGFADKILLHTGSTDAGTIFNYDAENGFYYIVSIPADTSSNNTLTIRKHKKEVYKHPIWQVNGASQKVTGYTTSNKLIKTVTLNLTELGIPDIRHGAYNLATTVGSYNTGKYSVMSCSYIKETHTLYIFSIVDAYLENKAGDCVTGANKHIYVLEVDLTQFELNNEDPVITYKDIDATGILTDSIGLNIVAKKRTNGTQYEQVTANALLFDGTYLYLKLSNEINNDTFGYCKSILKVNINDIADNYTIWDDTNTNITNVFSSLSHSFISNGLFVETGNGCAIINESIAASGSLVIIVQSSEIIGIKSIISTSDTTYLTRNFVVIDDVFVFSYSDNYSKASDAYLTGYINTTCLSTINKLNDIVIKTPASIMTITYELKEV